jgi:DNA-binding CsgD family transcriptional regulator
VADALGADDRPPAIAGAGELSLGREAADRLDWPQAYEALAQAGQAGKPMAAEDLELRATAAYLVGEVADCLQTMQRAHQAYADAGNRRRAARMLFWLGFVLLSQGEPAQAGGWLARASRLLVDVRPDCAEHGLLLIPQVIQASELGDHVGAAATAAAIVEIGSRTGDPEVRALGLHWQGRATVRDGRLPEGLVLLDESMTAVVAGEVAPYVAGSLYCSMIDACREIADIRRAHEWTVALTTWCDQQPDMFTFSGQCLVHRAEIMQLHGQWPQAVDEAKRACERFAHAADQYATGMAWYRLAEIYRAEGAVTEAAEAYRRAGEWGHDPQPGLALLWLAGGRTGAARSAVDRALAESTDRLRRAALLPAQVEIALAAGDVEAAATAAEELATIADLYGTPVLWAAAGRSRGAVRLVTGDARGALAVLRDAWQVWRDLDAPYEAAKVRVLIGQGCRALGDEDSAVLELDSARRVFAQLGARPDLARLDTLARPAPDAAAAHGITARELQVLRLLAAGKTNHAIAADLVLAHKTVDRHVSNIFAKLGVSSRAAATAYAYEHRLVPTGRTDDHR